MAKIHQLVLAALLPFSFAAAQQTITLNDGTQYQGRFNGGSPEAVTFIDQDGVRHRFPVNQIQSLYFNAPNAYSNNGYQGNQPPSPQYSNNNGYNNNGPGGPPPPPPGYSNNNGYNQPPNAGYNQAAPAPAYQQPAPPAPRILTRCFLPEHRLRFERLRRFIRAALLRGELIRLQSIAMCSMPTAM